VCVCACGWVGGWVRARVCACVGACVRARVHACVRTRVRVRVRACVRACARGRARVCLCACVHHARQHAGTPGCLALRAVPPCRASGRWSCRRCQCIPMALAQSLRMGRHGRSTATSRSCPPTPACALKARVPNAELGARRARAWARHDPGPLVQGQPRQCLPPHPSWNCARWPPPAAPGLRARPQAGACRWRRCWCGAAWGGSACCVWWLGDPKPPPINAGWEGGGGRVAAGFMKWSPSYADIPDTVISNPFVLNVTHPVPCCQGWQW